MRLDLRISPCPNDTFMFDAMINGRIDTEGLEFDVSFFDIEELNKGVLHGEPHISKISCATIPQIYERYGMLRSGSALGKGNGPLLVGMDAGKMEKIAVPGFNTTANLLMRKFFSELKDVTPVLFSEIADRVSAGEFDAGVLIHEGRFTYAEKGLRLICDLGARWEQATGTALPLGAIVASRTLPTNVIEKFDRVLKKSIEYAMDNPEKSTDFVKLHARELAGDVIKSHIALFVNDYSVNIGEVGKRAVAELTGIDSEKIFM